MKGGLRSAEIKHGEQFVVTTIGVQMMPMLCVGSLDTFSEVRLLLLVMYIWPVCGPLVTLLTRHMYSKYFNSSTIYLQVQLQQEMLPLVEDLAQF